MKLSQELRQSGEITGARSTIESGPDFSMKNERDYRTYTDQLREDGFIQEFTYAFNDENGHKLYSVILAEAKKKGYEYHQTINNGNVILWLKK